MVISEASHLFLSIRSAKKYKGIAANKTVNTCIIRKGIPDEVKKKSGENNAGVSINVTPKTLCGRPGGIKSSWVVIVKGVPFTVDHKICIAPAESVGSFISR